LQDERSLLSPGQIVTLGILKPQISVVEEDHIVKDEEQNYTTRTEEDPNEYTDYSVVKQAGVKGLNRATQKVQKVNGETVSVVGIDGLTEILKVPVEEVIVKGTKKRSYGWSGGYGDLIITKGMFGWPATCSTVSSGFGWRWGTLHDGTDIAGCGYGSNIFAAESGEVVTVSYKYDNGQYITIRHDNGYYTMYAHLCSGCTYVKVGDRVQRGQPIGGMGQTGFATGVHLHYAIWTGPPYAGGTALNAMNFY
jgi:murein DD-endopeptidase MepM/ murein hydrolase activator NlpD